jgi:hypothetical protein
MTVCVIEARTSSLEVPFPVAFGIPRALTTPYFAVTSGDGSFHVDHIPIGSYDLNIWYEDSSESELNSLSRDLDVTAGGNELPTISIHSSASDHEHLNKYGEPYPIDKPAKY